MASAAEMRDVDLAPVEVPRDHRGSRARAREGRSPGRGRGGARPHRRARTLSAAWESGTRCRVSATPAAQSPGRSSQAEFSSTRTPHVAQRPAHRRPRAAPVVVAEHRDGARQPRELLARRRAPAPARPRASWSPGSRRAAGARRPRAASTRSTTAASRAGVMCPAPAWTSLTSATRSPSSAAGQPGQRQAHLAARRASAARPTPRATPERRRPPRRGRPPSASARLADRT